jgi:hypothetical protein
VGNIGQDTQVDETFESLKEINEQDNALMQPVLEKLMDTLGEALKAENAFSTKHGYMAVGKLLIYLSQSLCKDEEHFKSELEASQDMAIDRVVQSILPKIQDGKIVEEGYDLENLSIRRIMLALGTAVDYVIWRTELSNYQQVRENLEKEQTATLAETEVTEETAVTEE